MTENWYHKARVTASNREGNADQMGTTTHTMSLICLV